LRGEKVPPQDFPENITEEMPRYARHDKVMCPFWGKFEGVFCPLRLMRCLTKGVQDDTSGQLEKGLIKEKRFQICPEEF